MAKNTNAALEQRDDRERAVEGDPPVHARQPEADGGDPADDGNVREPVRELVLPALSVEGLDEQLGDAIHEEQSHCADEGRDYRDAPWLNEAMLLMPVQGLAPGLGCAVLEEGRVGNDEEASGGDHVDPERCALAAEVDHHLFGVQPVRRLLALGGFCVRDDDADDAQDEGGRSYDLSAGDLLPQDDPGEEDVGDELAALHRREDALRSEPEAAEGEQ